MAKDRFVGKVVLITGGNSGIGLATAQRLVSEGGQVIITGRSEDKLKKAVQTLGNKAQGIMADVSKVSDVEALFAEIKSKYGHLDGIFANAGITVNESIEQISEKSLDSIMDTNIKGTYLTLQKGMAILSTGSAVVVNASAADTYGNTAMAFYGASKAAVRSMARSFSAAFIGKGIRVNAVSPGPIETTIWEGSNETRIDSVKQNNPSKRFGRPEEVGAAVAYLLSDESSYVVGVELYIDGGSTQL